MEVTELFDICQELAAVPPTSYALRKAHEVLVLTCAEGTSHLGGTFGNVFSQVDYLCKARGVSATDRVAIQTLRRHTGSHTQEDSSQPNDILSAEDWHYDLRALASFVSAVFKTDIPGELRRLLPSHNRLSHQEKKDTYKYIRCIVSKWDDTLITANTDDGEITIDYGTTEGSYDHSYLRKILQEGMQLNLLESTRSPQSSILTPKFIIVEPDFLLDISSIAACFTNYGHHPLLYTVNRLKPRPNTQAILLGNFAGTALDNIIHQKGEGTEDKDDIDTSLRQSFHEQALRFCTCEGFDAARFKRDAAQQIKNIREAVAVLAEDRKGQSYLLEASFVCEMLGLQGRVDMMTDDMTLLVEQKAGKNMKIERHSHDPHGLQQESHYVQLLLYYGILRYNFGRSDQTVDTRLLYSRYPANEGLLSVNFYRTLFAEAIRLRNQIVATELFIALEGFGRILPLLRSDIIYKGVAVDGYFSEYILPELQSLTSQANSLSPLERAYYERMMTFVYREQLFQKLGNSATRLYHSGGAISDLWLMPLQEKLDTGNIIIDLTIEKIEKSNPQGCYDLITLKGELDILNFRRGDMVYLYHYQEQPDVRKSILYKGNIAILDGSHITVMLNDGQQETSIFENDHASKWAIEHGSSDQSFSSNVRSLQQFICALPDRKALLLGQRSPKTDTSLHLSRSYSASYDKLLEQAKQALDYYLLVGPPGTGKTSQALRFLVEEELNGEKSQTRIASSSSSILLMAYTNRAVDEICAMLDEEGHAYLRLGNKNSCDPRFHHHLLDSALDSMSKLDDIRTYIKSCPIIVGTTSTIQSHQEIFTLKHFSLCIIDEASQILEPHIIGLLSHPHINRFILIGDHKQLPAVVGCDEPSSRIEEPLLHAIGLTDCRQSLFERLLRWEQHEGRTQFVGTLNHQGRMHPEVAQFACNHFYQQEHLQPVPLPHQKESGPLYLVTPEDDIDRRLIEQRVLFVPSTTDNEAELVAGLVGRIHHFVAHAFEPEKTIGIIVTYRSQIAPIRNAISRLGIASLENISIDTVERYQGSQRDVIIYALGISRRYQMDFLTANTFYEDERPIDRKLNVAMTRARRQLIITGNEGILSTNRLFREVIKNFS